MLTRDSFKRMKKNASGSSGPIFKAALDVPWNDWPATLPSDKAEQLFYVLKLNKSVVASDLNTVSEKILSRAHNLLICASLSDGHPICLRHFPSYAYISEAFFIVLEETDFSKAKSALAHDRNCRFLSLHIDEDLMAAFSKATLSQEYISTANLAKKIFNPKKRGKK